MQSETAHFLPGAATWRIERNMRGVFDSGPFASLCVNMTSSTKPEVHNILHCRQRRTEPRPLVKRTENVVKFWHVVFEICKRTDKQKNRYADRNTFNQSINQSNQSNLFATKQMNNFYSKARNMLTGHKGSFKTALTSALRIRIKNNITK